jgi:hypothetical protein
MKCECYGKGAFAKDGKGRGLALLLLAATLTVTPVRSQDLNVGSACSHLSGGCPSLGGGSHNDGSGNGGNRGGPSLSPEQKCRRDGGSWERGLQGVGNDAVHYSCIYPIPETPAEREQRKLDAKANKIAAGAFKDLRNANCAKAIELYDKALALDNFSPWRQNRAYCLEQTGDWGAALQGYFSVLNAPSTSEDDVKRVKWAIWSILYNHGRHCPEPPAFDGTTKGCVAVPGKAEELVPPLPTVSGKSWTLRNLRWNAEPFTITTASGYKYTEQDADFLVGVNILDATITTGAHTVLRFTLPDGHDFVLGPSSTLKMDSFIYDPNKDLTTVIFQTFIGFCRFVSSALEKEPSSIRVRLDVGYLGMRGTAVGVYQKPGEVAQIYVYDGEVTLDDEPIPSGSKFVYWFGGLGGYLVKLEGKEAEDILGFTDKWDMTPISGRELE